MKAKEILSNGIIAENPVLRLVLGTCPTIAVTTAVMNGVGMGAAATFVLIGSNVVVSALRNFIPDKVRIPAFIVIIATFVTIVQLLLKAYLPALDESLGIFIPLIVVNCIILARAESFAYKHAVGDSFLDGLAAGLGFTLALLLISAVREIIGSGTLMGVPLFGENFQPAMMFAQAPGGFLVFGFVLAAFNAVMKKRRKGRKA